jgi:hypothetical protein
VTEREAIEAIYGQWESAWESLHPPSQSDPAHVPFTFRNESYSPDALGQLGAWARISVIHTVAEQITFGDVGTRKFERRGNVFVQLFAPVAEGVGTLADLAQDARTCLEGMRLGELNLKSARTVEGTEDGRWAMSSVVVEFRYTDTR